MATQEPVPLNLIFHSQRSKKMGIGVHYICATHQLITLPVLCGHSSGTLSQSISVKAFNLSVLYYRDNGPLKGRYDLTIRNARNSVALLYSKPI